MKVVHENSLVEASSLLFNEAKTSAESICTAFQNGSILRLFFKNQRIALILFQKKIC